MIRLGPLVCRGYMKEWLFKILMLLWTVFLWVFLVCGFFSPQGQELLCECWMSLCSGSLCCAKLCLEGWGALSTYLLPKGMGNLFFIPILARIASGIHTVVWISGFPRNSLSSCAWNGGVILVGSPPLSLSTVLHCFLPMPKALVLCFLFYALVF